MKAAQDILIRPLITEKGTLLADQNKYLFAVALDATKVDVRRAVEQTFDVTVLSVNVINVPGKEKRWGRHPYRTSRWRKAIVTLQQGQTIDLFSGV
ncbi:MAG: 50S ribosomal protein L23 [Chloroflexota bacterium]|nr:50S ribosomal protein L23 [Chloroflexota bacterium]MDE2929801.1 50S ribosomal protein L23 [Chloroflexota bacterium]